MVLNVVIFLRITVSRFPLNFFGLFCFFCFCVNITAGESRGYRYYWLYFVVESSSEEVLCFVWHGEQVNSLEMMSIVDYCGLPF